MPNIVTNQSKCGNCRWWWQEITVHEYPRDRYPDCTNPESDKYLTVPKENDYCPKWQEAK
jgi:hypothetical protein